MTTPQSQGAAMPAVPPRRVPKVWRRLALVVAALRYVIPLVAVGSIPWLITRNITLLVLLRPTKEFLLVGGGQSRFLGEPDPLLLLLAFLPLGLFAIPAFFVVGRAYGTRLRAGEGPRWLTRAIPPDHVELGQRVLAKHGPAIAILGRFAAMPPTVLAAAAGMSDVSWRAYLAADAVGAALSAGATIAVGYALGRAYQEGSLLLTGIGLALFLVMIGVLTRWIRREARSPAAPPSVAARVNEPTPRGTSETTAPASD
jgi:membrane protein DedA with SNARE-associated domain